MYHIDGRVSSQLIPHLPHLLTNAQKLARVRNSKQLLKQFPKYNHRSFANIITGDETWIHFNEPKRKITKYGQPKEVKDLEKQNAP
jgi:hypothetical protein